MTRRTDAAFPVVANIRKGAKKEPKRPGKDLLKKFRIDFVPGSEKFQERFLEVYKTYTPERIHAIIPFQSVWKGWEFSYEAYSAGRRIAQADDEHYLFLRGGHAGKDVIIRDGTPEKPFDPVSGETVEYEAANGKKMQLPMKATGRLNLLLPEMGAFVYFRLVTTSIYDRWRIEEHLASIQAIADAINGGNAAGIPFYIYRMECDIVWNKKDGSASRIKKWLVTIEIDEEAVGKMISRMSNMAISGPATVPMLKAENEIVVYGEFVDDEEDGDEETLEAIETEDEEENYKASIIDDMCNTLFRSLAEDRKAKLLGAMSEEKVIDWLNERFESVETEEGLIAHMKSNWPGSESDYDNVKKKLGDRRPFDEMLFIRGVDALHNSHHNGLSAKERSNFIISYLAEVPEGETK